jgi:hypothetical protein
MRDCKQKLNLFSQQNIREICVAHVVFMCHNRTIFPSFSLIQLNLKSNEAYMLFAISNTIQDIPRRVNGRFLTSKADSTMYDIGLQSARRIEENYSRQLKAEAKDEIFTLNFALKNAKLTALS